MSIAIVHTTEQKFTLTTTPAITIPSTTAGNLLVITFDFGNASSISSITDNGSSPSYAQCSNAQAVDSAGGAATDIWYSKNIAGGITQVTVTQSASHPITMWVYEVSGCDTASPFDTANFTSNGASTSTPTGPSITASFAAEFLVSNLNPANTTTAAGNGFTLDTVGAGGEGSAHQISSSTGSFDATWTQNAAGTWCGSIAGFKAAASAVTTSSDDGDAQSQRFAPSTRMESQHQQELSDTFGILPPRPPFAFEDDGANMRWSDWRALNYDDSETHRALPPIPPFSIQEEFTEELNVDWRARQFEDTDTHRSLPPTPPAAIQDEISERGLPGAVPFFEEDQAGKPIIVAPAPNVGLDDIEAHIKAADRVNLYHEDDFSTFAPIPPFSIQDDEQHTWRGWLAPAIEDDQATLPPVPPVVRFSIQDDEQHSWRGWSSPAIEDDWSTTAPAPPLAFEDDLKAISQSPTFFSITDTDLVGTPPVPQFFGDDESSLQRYMIRGLSALIILDEFVGAPVAGGLGPASLASIFAAVRPAIDSLSSAVRPAIDSQGAATRPAIDSQSGIVRPS